MRAHKHPTLQTSRRHSAGRGRPGSEVVALVLCLIAITAARAAAQEQFTYSGDGLTVIVTSYDEDQNTVAGTIERGGKRFPFKGMLSTDGDAEVVRGTFTADGQSFPFHTRQASGSEEVVFTTGNKTYRLRPSGAAAAGDAALGGDAPKPANPPAADAASVLNEPLKRVTFRDLSMGGVVSHHMLIPLDWQHEGHIEWSQDTYFPQTRVKVTGPDGSKISFLPAMNFMYTEAKPVAGFPPLPPQGTPPPQNLGEWLVSFLQQKNPSISNIRLISDERNREVEAQLHAQNQQMRANAQGEQIEVHLVTYAYDHNGRRYREQLLANMYRMPPFENENIRSLTWSLYPVVLITAPDEKFDQMRPKLIAIFGTFRQVPKWWWQMMEVRSEIIAQRHRDNMEAIRRRGQMYEQMSDAQYRQYKERTSSSDEAQRQRIQGIYEVQDYQDRDGSLVELTIHRKHVFSDGQGNLVLTNNYNDKPGAQWEEIRPPR